jgi:hypothetical protein
MIASSVFDSLICSLALFMIPVRPSSSSLFSANQPVFFFLSGGATSAAALTIDFERAFDAMMYLLL